MNGLILIASFGLVGFGLSDEKSKPQTSLKDAKQVVITFYQNLKDGKPSLNERAFLSPEAIVSGSFYAQRHHHWNKKASEWLAQWKKDAPNYLELDDVQIDSVHETLAIAKIKFRAAGEKGWALINLRSDGKKWQIAAFYVDSYLVW